MEDRPLQKVTISGPTLAFMIQRFSSSLSPNVDGLLFGHVTHIPPTLSDDSPSSSSLLDSSSTLVATVTGFLCSGATHSFYDSLGRVDSSSLRRLLAHHHHDSLIGWFSSRRRSSLRPSLRESSVSASLSSNTQLSFPVKDSESKFPVNSAPSLFLLFSSPSADQFVHTHDYRAYQFRVSTRSFDPKSIDIVNIGPAFRGQYGSFSPNSPFPLLPHEFRSSPMNEDGDEESLSRMKRVSEDQRQLNMCAEGFQIGNLSRLMGSEAVRYTTGLEDLYEKMLAKIQILSTQVEQSSAKILEQENHNRKLRHKVAGL